MHEGALRGQKGVLNPLEMDSTGICSMWVLVETELRGPLQDYQHSQLLSPRLCTLKDTFKTGRLK